MSDGSPVIHVVDDDDSFRAAVSRLLRAAGYEVKGYRSAGDFLLERPTDGPGCVLLDLRLPGPNGLELQDALIKQGGWLPVIFLSGQGDIRQTVLAMRQGAVDFLTKPVRRKELLTAVAEALARQSAEAAVGEQRRELQARFARLTAREREVFGHVVAGRLNKQIAAALGTSERTVKAHRSRIMEKMEVGSIAELVHAEGWLRPRSKAVAPTRGDGPGPGSPSH